MSDLVKPVTHDADQLLALIKQLIKEKQYDGVVLLFTSTNEAGKNLLYLPEIGKDIYHSICLEHLNDKTKRDDPSLYSCAEELLQEIAYRGPIELLFDYLELVEESKSENVFTSALKAVLIFLLKRTEKTRDLEWSLNSIYTCLQGLPLPDYLKDGYDTQQQQLLEQNKLIESVLAHYIIVNFFYEPILKALCPVSREEEILFRPVGKTRRNVLCCFLIKILGKPLSLLDLSNNDGKANTYSIQCAKALTQAANRCISDPLFLLSFVETRAHRRKSKDAEMNIFLVDEMLPLDCLAIYYYMIFVERIDRERIPLVYHPLYVLESCLYVINELLLQNEVPLHGKALLLMQKLLENLRRHIVPVSSLELEIHKLICLSLCNLIGYSSDEEHRKLGLKVLRQYIISFEDEGKYLIIKNLLKSINHRGISGYLIFLYKDLVGEALQNSEELPSCYCGNDFRYLFMHYICHLPQGYKADLLENSDNIISSLNTLRYFAIKDVENRTGFWNFAADLQTSYLDTLRKALDLSVAHFKGELHNVELAVQHSVLDQLKLLDINVANDKQTSKVDLQLDREKKLKILHQNLCTFDLIRSLLSRACECLENSPKCIKSK